jgi:hypothetical protein
MKIMIMITMILLAAYFMVRWCGTPALRRYVGVPFLVSYLIPLYASVIVPSAALFVMLLLVTFLATTRDRVDAACRFIMLVFLLPPMVWQVSIGPMYLFDIDEVTTLSLALVLKCLFTADRKVPPLRGLTVEDAFVALFFVIFWLGAGRFPSVLIVVRGGLVNGLFLLLPYIALRLSIRSSEEFMRVAACFAAAAVMLGIFALYEGFHGWSLFAIWRDITDLESNTVLMRRGDALRAPATMGGPLMLGIVLLMGVAATLYSRPYVRRPWMLAVWAGIMALGMLMTQSRGNVALLPVVILIFCMVRRKWGYAAIVGLGGPAALALLLAVAPLSPRIAAFLNIDADTTSLQSGQDTDYDYRQVLLRRGLEEAAKHRLTGTSLKQAVEQLADITQGEGIVDLVNTYLTLYLVSGLVGIVPFLLLLVTVASKLMRPTSGPRNSPLNDTRALAITTFVTIVVQLSFMSVIDRIPVCLMFPLAAARLVGIGRRRLRPAPLVAGMARADVPSRVAQEPLPPRRPSGFGAPAVDPA